MRFDVGDLETLKSSLRATIDAEAEAIRGLFITLGAGQALVYEQKLREAELVMANTAAGEDGLQTTVQAGEVPNLSIEAHDLGVSLFDAALAVIEAAHQWSQLSAGIELLRLGHKRRVTAATTAAEASAAGRVDWSAITPGSAS